MNVNNKDVSLDDVNAEDGQNKVDFGDVESGGGDSNDGGGIGTNIYY